MLSDCANAFCPIWRIDRHDTPSERAPCVNLVLLAALESQGKSSSCIECTSELCSYLVRFLCIVYTTSLPFIAPHTSATHNIECERTELERGELLLQEVEWMDTMVLVWISNFLMSICLHKNLQTEKLSIYPAPIFTFAVNSGSRSKGEERSRRSSPNTVWVGRSSSAMSGRCSGRGVTIRSMSSDDELIQLLLLLGPVDHASTDHSMTIK